MRTRTKISIIVVLIISISIISVVFLRVDNLFSGFKGSTAALQFPSQLTVGGKVFSLLSSTNYASKDQVRDYILAQASEQGITAAQVGDRVNQGVDLVGVTEAKIFFYKAADGSIIRGGVAKGESPLGWRVYYEIGKTMTPGIVSSLGKDTVLTNDGSIQIGDVADKYTTNLLVNYPNPNYPAKQGYFIIGLYSNLFVFAGSYDSYDNATEAAKMAINTINLAK
ncbi:hypothetical protein MUP77_20950 [Candidatus Bathyarchaeota archaeon]|nr:hypothetical protein [Candidatus Bathyarchaeota archaeon]